MTPSRIRHRWIRHIGLWCGGALEMQHQPHPVMSRHELTVDHIVPTSRGGTNEYDNLRVLCDEVNQLKAGAYPENAALALSTAVPQFYVRTKHAHVIEI